MWRFLFPLLFLSHTALAWYYPPSAPAPYPNAPCYDCGMSVCCPPPMPNYYAPPAYAYTPPPPYGPGALYRPDPIFPPEPAPVAPPKPARPASRPTTPRTQPAPTMAHSAAAPTTAPAHDDKAHWSYAGTTGPEHWGELDPKFALCSSGKNQTPIDLNQFIEGDLAALKLNYKVGGDEVLNNGHTIQLNFPTGSSLEVDGKKFELKQLHFHSPSENWIDGNSFPMEVHLVHADRDGNLAVIGVMFSEGAANPELGKLWANMPQQANERKGLPTAAAATAFLPRSRDYYRFEGSLTTPPLRRRGSLAGDEEPQLRL